MPGGGERGSPADALVAAWRKPQQNNSGQAHHASWHTGQGPERFIAAAVRDVDLNTKDDCVVHHPPRILSQCFQLKKLRKAPVDGVCLEGVSSFCVRHGTA